MKRSIQVFLIAGLLVSLFGCNTGNPPDQPPETADGKTYVWFNNLNDFPVTVYTDSSRIVPFTDIAANTSSDAIETTPNTSGARFYPRYFISIENIAISYNGDTFIARINAKQ
jgi:hypothetical protein